VSFTWNAPSSVEETGGSPVIEYWIYWDNATDGAYFEYLDSTEGANTYFETYDEIRPGKTFQYKVSAVNNMGAGPESEPLSITISDVPDAPYDIVEDSSTADSITFSWTEPYDNGSQILDYTIYSDLGNGGMAFYTIETDVLETSYTLENLTPDTTV
jgi:hypothetical protein